MNRDDLIRQLGAYQTDFAAERPFIAQFTNLLSHPKAFDRDHLPGHITGSAWILNEDFSHVLLVLHAKLGRWLQPGGHADGEENVLNVALREAEEETGVKQFKILHPDFFDLDIHPIPLRKDFPAHFHYDIRFIVQAASHEPLIISEESNDLKWVPLQELGALTVNNPSIMRMVEKTRNFTRAK